jgi:uncharacterized membrane protein YkoI
MKNLSLLIGTVAIFSLNACGPTNKDVPTEVQSTFTQKFPEATKVKWDKENDTEWEAEFLLNGKEYSANFDNTGTWLETEYKVSLDELPASVIETLEDVYTGYDIQLFELSETADGTVYEFTLNSGEEKLSVTINENGNVLEEAAVEAVKEEDND